MSKTVYFKDNFNRLYTVREVRQYNINTKGMTKVVRSRDEITQDKTFGRYDFPLMDSIGCSSVGDISTKQLRKIKISKQMVALGLV